MAGFYSMLFHYLRNVYGFAAAVESGRNIAGALMPDRRIAARAGTNGAVRVTAVTTVRNMLLGVYPAVTF